MQLLFENIELVYITPLIAGLAFIVKLYGIKHFFHKIHRAINPLIPFIRGNPGIEHSLLIESLSTTFIVLIVLGLAGPYYVYEEKIAFEEKGIGSLAFKVSPPVILIIDVSGSMRGTKIEKAKEALLTFLNTLNHTLDVGLIAFDGYIVLSIPPTSDYRMIANAIKTMEANGGTMYSYPLETAYTWLKPYREFNVSVFVVFASDGLPADTDKAMKILEKYEEEEIPLYCIFIGYSRQGYELLQEMSNRTGGQAYQVTEIDKLVETYKEVAKTIMNKTLTNITVTIKHEKTITIKHSLTKYFIVAALLDLFLLYILRWRRFTITF